MKTTTHLLTQRGFTLMEMMLVLGIIALLIGVGTRAMVGVFGDAERGRIKADISRIETNLIRYKTNARYFPTTQQGLDALVNPPSAGPKPARWERVSKEEGILDPWGRKYQYAYPGKYNPDSYDIYSMGRDGKAGTTDDLGNW